MILEKNEVLFKKTEARVLDIWLYTFLGPSSPTVISRPQTL